MAEPEIVVEHREHLWYLLAEAAQVEHLIMCQYLYASFSLKAGPEDGLTGEQAAAVARWRDRSGRPSGAAPCAGARGASPGAAVQPHRPQRLISRSHHREHPDLPFCVALRVIAARR